MQETEDCNDWTTSCGQCFSIIDGSPTDNKFVFCCYCGAKVIEKPFVWEGDDE